MTPSALSGADPDPRQRIPTGAPTDPAGSPDTGQARVPALAVSSEVVAAFAVFYRGAVPRLVAFLRWHGAALPDAADCVQDTLAECYRKWATIDQPYPWCRTVAARYARHVAAVREQLTDTPDAVGSPLLPADTDLDALEHRHTILAVLDMLPVRQRQVLAWTYDDATPNRDRPGPADQPRQRPLPPAPRPQHPARPPGPARSRPMTTTPSNPHPADADPSTTPCCVPPTPTSSTTCAAGSSSPQASTRPPSPAPTRP